MHPLSWFFLISSHLIFLLLRLEWGTRIITVVYLTLLMLPLWSNFLLSLHSLTHALCLMPSQKCISRHASPFSRRAAGWEREVYADDFDKLFAQHATQWPYREILSLLVFQRNYHANDSLLFRRSSVQVWRSISSLREAFRGASVTFLCVSLKHSMHVMSQHVQLGYREFAWRWG